MQFDNMIIIISPNYQIIKLKVPYPLLLTTDHLLLATDYLYLISRFNNFKIFFEP